MYLYWAALNSIDQTDAGNTRIHLGLVHMRRHIIDCVPTYITLPVDKTLTALFLWEESDRPTLSARDDRPPLLPLHRHHISPPWPSAAARRCSRPASLHCPAQWDDLSTVAHLRQCNYALYTTPPLHGRALLTSFPVIANM